MIGTPRADDIVSAALGDLCDAALEREGQPAALGDDPEVVAADQHSISESEVLIVFQLDDRAPKPRRPAARHAGDPLRLIAEPVQAGHRQEAVRIGSPSLVGTVPCLPLAPELRAVEKRCDGRVGHRGPLTPSP